MEFDQAFQGSFDWSFPSPTATPTASHFPHQTTLQTPKTGPYPTHFQDAFSTPQPHIYTTPQQALLSSNTPVERPRTSSEYLSYNFYAHMPPPQSQGYPANHLSSVNPHVPVQHVPRVPSGFMPAYDTAQMQTPPPTRATSVKKPQQFAPAAFGTPSTLASRRHMTPQQNPHLVRSDNRTITQQTPVHFPQLQMSPDLYQFGNFGPASAPVVPSSQIFWDQAVSPGTVPQHRPLDDPFAPNVIHNNVVFSNFAGHEANPQVTMFDTPAMRTFPVQAPLLRPSSAAPLTSTQLPSQPLLPPTTIGVDPSLVYSSPIRQPSRSLSARKSRAEAAKRKDSANSATAKAAAAEEKAASDSALRRSNTTGNARSQLSNLAQVTATPISQSHSLGQPPRTASPLKRVGKTPLGSISESRSSLRRSVILTVDENGRAQATKVDESPTKSIRDRYPGLFDSDSSDDDDEKSVNSDHGSRTASFSFVKGEERKAKAVKLDPPVENLEGLSIPRSSSVASNRPIAPSRAALAAVAQLRRQGSVKKKPVARVLRKNDPNASSISLIDSCPMDPSVGASIDRNTSLSPSDDAGPNRLAKDSANASPELMEGFNHRRGIMPAGQQHSQRSEAQPNPLIRCACGDASSGLGQLLQCVSCTHWVHASCVGVNPHIPQPHDYVCLFCIDPGLQQLRRNVYG